MKTGFLFFVADHLLVGRLCTNPRSDRSLLFCLKVTQCSTCEIGDAPHTTHALYRSKLWPEPAGLLRMVIRREHHQHDLPQHQSQTDRRHPPSIHPAPAGASGKGMLPVPDPYRGGDWGWRRLHWICLLYYIIKLPELIFSIKVLK